MDYQGNSKSSKEPKAPVDKNIERVVVSEVIIKKKPFGRRFRDKFIEADFRSVVAYVVSAVLIPAARNMIMDAGSKGLERTLYGERGARERPSGVGSRVTYNTPVNRGGYRESRYAPAVSTDPRSSRQTRDDLILSSRQEAELVLERMNDIIDNYEVASVADLNELVGLPTSHVDSKWGWIYLGDVQVRQIREGYLIDLPAAEPIQ